MHFEGCFKLFQVVSSCFRLFQVVSSRSVQLGFFLLRFLKEGLYFGAWQTQLGEFLKSISQLALQRVQIKPRFLRAEATAVKTCFESNPLWVRSGPERCNFGSSALHLFLAGNHMKQMA